MPTHVHLMLKQTSQDGVSSYMARVLDGYTKYFNIKYKRKGPLWEGHFENVLVKNDEQLLHLSRYIHLNPTSANLVNKPQDWKFSSYHDYINQKSKVSKGCICDFKDMIDTNSRQYAAFINDRVSYQQEFSKIKRIIIEDYTG